MTGTALTGVLRHSGTLSWRGLVRTVHSPEALIDVTLQPVIFLLLSVSPSVVACGQPDGSGWVVRPWGGVCGPLAGVTVTRVGPRGGVCGSARTG